MSSDVRAKIVVAVSIIVGVLGTTTVADAHGVGERGDLPLDTTIALSGAGFAVVISFAALGVLWSTPRLDAASRFTLRKRSLLTGASWVLRIAGLLMTVVVLVAGLLGRGGANSNISLVAVYVIFWVGVPAASAIFGNVWSLISPFETIALLMKRWLPVDEEEIEDRATWIAIIPLLSFLWLELAYHDNAAPRIVGLFAFAYTLGILMVLFARGAEAMRSVEGFGVLFSHIALLSPVVLTDGKIGWRRPLAGATTLRPGPSTMVLLLVVLGGTTFDGFSRTTFWNDQFVGQRRGWELTIMQSLGLLFVIGVVIALYLAGSLIGASIAGRQNTEFAAEFGHTLIPIALAYAVAHYFSLLVFEGQLFWKLLSDPFAEGWDLFGTADRAVNFLAVSPDTIGWVQMGAIVVGHVLAVILAHDRAIQRYDPVVAFRSQFPLLVVMVIYTVGGLFLLAGV